MFICYSSIGQNKSEEFLTNDLEPKLASKAIFINDSIYLSNKIIFINDSLFKPELKSESITPNFNNIQDSLLRIETELKSSSKRIYNSSVIDTD